MQAVKNYFKEKNYPLTEKDLDLFISKLTIHKKVKRFDFLLKEGEIGKNFYFILKGAFRSYIVQNDQEYCDVLRGPNEIYCDYVSFLTQQPGRYYLQALSNAELIGISRENHRQLGEDNWNIERVWRLETEKLFIYRTARDHILRLAAKDRIKHLLFIRPALFQHIPHKYIASYLRMTPETFSREIATLTGL